MKNLIRNLVQDNFLFTDKQRKNIFTSLNTLNVDNDKLKKLLKVVKKAEERKDEVLKRMLEDDPKLFEHIRELDQQKRRDFLKERERVSRQEESYIFADLGLELKNIN